SNREGAYNSLRENSKALKNWLAKNVSDDQAYSLGFYRSKTTMTVGKETGKLSPFEVHSVRPGAASDPAANSNWISLRKSHKPGRRISGLMTDIAAVRP